MSLINITLIVYVVAFICLYCEEKFGGQPSQNGYPLTITYFSILLQSGDGGKTLDRSQTLAPTDPVILSVVSQ